MSFRKKSGRNRFVSATELAELGACERRLILDRRFGKPLSRSARRSAAQGIREHERHHRAVQRFAQTPAVPTDRGGDRRCFVASVVYGVDAPQTHCLRSWRDAVLMPSVAGRMLVWCYYRLSPAAVVLLRGSPRLTRAARWLLDRVLLWIG